MSPIGLGIAMRCMSDRVPACGHRDPVNPDRKSRQWLTQSVRLRIAAESAVAGLSASIGLNPASAV
jgi:hypothetical protein